MYVYQYRAPRFPSDFPVDLVVGSSTVRGRCTNINSAGIQAQFFCPTPVGEVGMLTLSHTMDAMKLYARVSYTAANQTGFSFIFRTEGERAQLIRFVQLVAGGHIGQTTFRPGLHT